MEERQSSSKPKLMPGQQVMNSFLLQKDEASRGLVLHVGKSGNPPSLQGSDY
jgi:hypothetical protein